MQWNSLGLIMIVEYIELLTDDYNQMICITSRLEELINESNVRNGIVTVQTLHTTTGIMINECLDCLESDIDDFLCKLIPENGNYSHARMLDDYGSTAGNPTGHLKSMLVGNHCHMFIIDGKIKKGGAQEVYFMEFDGPSQRTVMVCINEI